MPKKLTIEEMHNIAAGRGGKCLSESYRNSSTKLLWQCAKTHKWESTPTNVKNGGWCPYCAGKLATPDRNLLKCHPKVAEEWHPIKNQSVTPDQVTPRSNRKFWWTCKKNHEWQASVVTRVNGHKCPYCTNRKVCSDNNLRVLFPEISDQWHQSKNMGLLPKEIVPGYHKKVWWQCEKGHEWHATVESRTSRGYGCPVCSGHVAGVGFNLGDSSADFLKEWHSERNGKLKPSDLTSGSSRKVWWQCKFGHEWQAPPKSRTRGSGCPYCFGKTSRIEVRFLCELRVLFGEIDWRKKIDGKECDLIISSLSIGIEIDGYPWHLHSEKRDLSKTQSLEAAGLRVYRIRDSRLPLLSDLDIHYKDGELHFSILKRFLEKLIVNAELDDELGNAITAYLENDKLQNDSEFRRTLAFLPGPIPEKSLASLYPELCIEWHQEKNYPLTPEMFSHGSGKKVWWKCKKNHEWQEKIGVRSIAKYGCPYCSGNRIGADNNFAFLYPELLAEWHPTKNKKLDPHKIAPKSGRRVWWICPKGHEWETALSQRTHSRTNCPHCSNRAAEILPENSLNTLNPKLVMQWHPSRNGKLSPLMVSPGSNKKAWWICENGHEWEASIADRNSGHGCSYCAGKLTAVEDSLKVTFPEIASQWYQEKNGKLNPESLSPGSGRKVWWLCKRGHKWQAVIQSRTSRGYGCPYCSGQRATVENNLKTKFPVIAEDWHSTRNGILRPDEVAPKSNKSVWWQCRSGHEFIATPKARTRGRYSDQDGSCKECRKEQKSS